ncbi:hypothetical protein PV10_02877 [Exophiala mesophila]|uniref:Uncharacterized protein n=1 Tax=Exophiala mesophila TaxID=212818 RepID=A0A0D2A888_EXOME|nr:uncharacterized protein PV10_02877 [Exophiala mesophila]KIV95198.1 hypothetical protein PV10_02877 [Exophiala mesophila]
MGRKNQSVPVTYIRGGTSKALFFHEHHVPPPGIARDRFLKRVMGTPDPLQIDGMGGSHIVTSKIALIRPSERPDADVDYTFAQVSINDDFVGYSGNCGNISAGVGPFAIDEDLVKEKRPGVSMDPKIKTQEVRIFNTGTNKLLISHVPIDPATGNSLEPGDASIDGCPGTGAPILMDYSNVVGGALNKGAIPTNSVIDTAIVNGVEIEFSICDVGNILVFAPAQALGIQGNERPGDLDKDAALIARVKELRGKAAVIAGMCKDWELVDEQSPMLPMVTLVSPSTDPEFHLQSRLFLDNKCHTSMAGTGSICTAACSRIPGTIVHRLMSEAGLQETTLKIQHPSGSIPVVVISKPLKEGKVPDFETLSFVRTARRIFDGNIYIPDNVKDCFPAVNGVNGHTNGVSASEVGENPITTKGLAKFVSGLEYADLTVEVQDKLRLLLLDYIGVTSAATIFSESSDSLTKAIKALNAGYDGKGNQASVIKNGPSWSAPLAAMLNGALSHSLDFDDTHAGGALHPGVSVVSAALAEAETNTNASPQDLLTALAAGYEVTCRLGVALGNGGYVLGFHNTSTAGIFGAVAAIARLRHADVETVENAFGLALSKAAGSMQYLANGSWNKRLHPGFAAHDAFACVTLAESGVVGAAEPIEGRYGLLNLYSSTGATKSSSSTSSSPSPSLSLPFLKHWEFLSTAVKPYASCRMTHGPIELAAQLAQLQQTHGKPQSIKISLSQTCYRIVGEPTDNKLRPQNVVDAQFSVYYQTAVAWLHGNSGLGWKIYDYIGDSAVHDIIDAMEVLSVDSHVGLESSLEVVFSDGYTSQLHLRSPTGEPDNPSTWDNTRVKFMALATGVYGEAQANKICEAVKDVQNVGVRRLMKLVR